MQLILNPFTTPSVSHIFDDFGREQTLEKLLASSDGPTKWTPVLSNEWGRLAQGNITGVKITDTIDFISFVEVLKD